MDREEGVWWSGIGLKQGWSLNSPSKSWANGTSLSISYRGAWKCMIKNGAATKNNTAVSICQKTEEDRIFQREARQKTQAALFEHTICLLPFLMWVKKT